ncbi:NAD(P)/FAD-dependent oxidoreductase [Rhodobacter sp. NTK016B]|uniref:NAD(P)/FAD-dependent oxidoreductase n=1 Tax=Rhodobacter sp. NTK016B TaxID=2759676 RepID=UPI001A8C583F|nr:NAD(P)/FAD-dependent oxidoreductase [Rhodobacter sp. NTK016B]MBN8291816.1 NAD(P)/FAD-dependent oxidoreductase [Rhodobacter sp. NTK016B]
MDFDVIVVGGSFAGLSAAMQLARARKHVLILDTGEPRNRFAASSHGFPGQDGQAPAEIKARLQAELSVYATVSFRQSRASKAERSGSGFTLWLDDGARLACRRLILAYGMRDHLPDLPGLTDRWGATVLHCPYCHGYELDQQPVGVLALNELAIHQAMMLPDWGQTTLFTQGALDLSSEQRATLLARGVRIEETPVTGLIGDAPALSGVRLADGRTVPLAGLFLAPRVTPASDLAEQLACAFEDGPTGPYVAVDPMKAASVTGVFAAGDLASPMANATLAAAAGVLAGGAAHRSLIFDPDLVGKV